MRTRGKVNQVIDLLIEKAIFFGHLGFGRGTDKRRLERIREQGKEIPDELLPGRFVQALSEEDRESLKDLTAEMLQVRKEHIL